MEKTILNLTNVAKGDRGKVSSIDAGKYATKII